MRITYQKTMNMNPIAMMRKAGYSPFTDPNTKEDSFTLRTGPDFYPRFHVYIHEDAQTIGIDLHLDQKKPQYKGARAHNGEYDGPTIEREIARIAGWIKSLYGVLPSATDALEATLQPQKDIPPVTQNNKPKDPGLFGGIF